MAATSLGLLPRASLPMQSLGRTTPLLLLLASALALPPTPTQKRRYDLVIYGATGFTGRLAAEYMESRYRKTTVTWALAGRSREKLESLAKEIGADDVPLLVADANDADAVAAMVGDAKAVANFAGTPFLTKALPVVEACGRLGTHYVDITGETALHRASAARYDALAKSTGACVVHSCGYDSVPSDLGYLLANDAYRHLHGGRAPSRARYVSRSFSGGASGGSIYTGLALFGFADELFDDDARRLVAETSGKYPLSDVCGPDATDTVSFPEWDWLADAWAMPFIMAGAHRRPASICERFLGDETPSQARTRPSSARARRSTATTCPTTRSRPTPARASAPTRPTRRPWGRCSRSSSRRRGRSSSATCCPSPARGRTARRATAAASTRRSSAPASRAP